MHMKTLLYSSLLSLCNIFFVLFWFLSLYGCAQSTDPIEGIVIEDKEETLKVHNLFTQNSLIEKDKSGIDFIMVSRDNDYLVELDFDGDFSVLNLHDNTVFSVAAPAVELSDNPSLFRYISENAENNLAIQFHKTQCKTEFNRGMDYELSVDSTNKQSKTSKTFYGCGEYVPDYSLHNIWRITELNGELLLETDFVRDFPFFELDMTTKTVLGNDGCNRVSADIIIEHQKIGFGLFMGTRMACVKMEKGDEITTALSNQMFDYVLEENRLILSQDGKVIMVLETEE